MSHIKDLLISLEDFIIKEHGHHSDDYMKKLESDKCPIYEHLNKKDYSQLELIEITLEEDEELYYLWAKSEDMNDKDTKDFLIMISSAIKNS